MENVYPVLILGAGISGLSAAWQLRQYGIPSLILEARERIGGRIHTTDDWGFPIDLGANWLHYAEGNPLLPWIENAGIKLIPTDLDDVQYFSNTGPFDRLTAEHGAKHFDSISQQAKEIALNGNDQVLRPLFERLIAERNSSPQEKAIVEMNVYAAEALFAADFNKTSAQGYFDGAGEYGEGDKLVCNGYRHVCDFFAQGQDIRLAHKVLSVTQFDDHVIVETTQGKFQAKCVISTIPTGVLRRNEITFTPPLPDRKAAALQRLEPGLLNKLVLLFEEKFWDDHDVFRFADSPYASTFDLYPGLKRPVWLSFVHAKTAVAFEAESDEETLRWWQDSLARHFPNKNTKIKAMKKTRWQQDPYAYGSYTYLPFGSTHDDLHALAEPMGRLFFAGESTIATDYSYTHGAHLSGLRAAIEVREFLT